MKSIFYIFTTVLLGTTAVAAHADTGECDKYKTGYDRTYCFAKLFMEADKELNTVYTELREAIKESTKQKLKETQRDWIQYRNTTCEENPGTINVDCSFRVNQERTEYLRSRLLECKAGSCRTDLIGQRSWK